MRREYWDAVSEVGRKLTGWKHALRVVMDEIIYEVA